MESWIFWEQVCRVMAALFMVTSLAAAAAALILLIRENLAERLGRECGDRYIRRLGLLAVLAVGVWILVIGQSARAAENTNRPGAGSTQPGPEPADSAEKYDPERAAEAEPPAGTGEGAVQPPAGTGESAGEGTDQPPAGTGEGTDQPPAGAGEGAGEGATLPPEPVIEDTRAPSVEIRMAEEVNRDSSGIANCRRDNAGVAVTFLDEREDDLGIRSYKVTVSDAAGKEIVREWYRGKGQESPGRVELAVETEEVAELSDGKIRVTAQAEDEAGNKEEGEYFYILDTQAPLLVEIMTYGSGEESGGGAQGDGGGTAGGPAEERTLYDGRDLYYRDGKLTTRIRIEEENEVSWEISYLELPGPGAESGNSIDRQKTGSGNTGEAVITKEGVYGGWRISGQDAAGNQLSAARDCRCTQDAEDYGEDRSGICLARRKIIDRTAPEAQIRYSSKANGYRYVVENGEEVYFGADVRAEVSILDRCGDLEMPVDAEQFRLVRWSEADSGASSAQEGTGTAAGSGPAEVTEQTLSASGAAALVGKDGSARFGAYGRDRAGNGLTVREVFEEGVFVTPGAAQKVIPYSVREVRTEQGDAAACLPGTTIVRDTVKPVLAASVSVPTGNPAAIDREEKIVYYGGDRSLYEGGRKEVRVRFEVTDANADEDRVEIRTAYAKVPEGQFCDRMRPVWEKAQAEDVSADARGGRLVFELVKIPAAETMPDGVYRFGIAGTDKAGNPLTADKKKGGSHSSGSTPAASDSAAGDSAGSDPAASDPALYGAVCEDSAAGIFMTGRKVVDTAAPAGEIRIVNKDGDEYFRTSAHRDAWVTGRKGFMPYRRETLANVTWAVQDSSPAGIAFRIVSTQRSDAGACPDGSDYRNGNSGSLQIRGGQVFRLEQAQLRDRAGNCSALLRRTVNFYLDTQIPDIDIDTPSVSVTATTAITVRNPDGRDLYGGGVHLKIRAQDPDAEKGASGLREVRCEIHVDGRKVREEVLFDGAQEEAAASGQTPAQSQAPPAASGQTPAQSQAPPAAPAAEPAPIYTIDREVDIPSGGMWESNDIEITVTAQDNAGNSSDPGAGGTYRFGIDSTGPGLTVAYDNNDVMNGKYFAKPRRAVITAAERNFDADRIRVTAPGAKAGAWQFAGRGAGGDADAWTMEVRFETDGEYTLAVEGTDALGNAASVAYTGEAPQSFVVDRTPPVIDVTWDNEDVRNGKYYNRARRALIRIRELSFDPRAVKILPASGAFRKEAEAVYETEVLYDEDGRWDLRCSCTDLAGNTAVPVSGEAFVIDRTPPRICFDRESVEEMGAYGEDVFPQLRWEEENPSGDCFAVWSNLTARGQVMARRRAAADGAKEITLPDPPQIREADGICVLSAGMCDLAGNRVYIRRNLSVNRFGSVYDISADPATLEMVNDYYTDATVPFVVTEYNVSPLVLRDVTLFRNGAARLLREGEEYQVTEEKNPSGLKYVYRIDPKAFYEEGTYSILLQSEDETGRQNSSPGRFRQSGEGDFSPSWAVDRTPPTIRLAGVDTERERFVTDSVPVSLIPSDNLELGELCVRILDDRGRVLREEKLGKEALRAVLDRNRGEVPVKVEAAREWQTLEAYVTDGAGLRSIGMLTDTAAGGGETLQGYRLLVSASPIVHLYRSGFLPALAFLALIGTIGFTKIL